MKTSTVFLACGLFAFPPAWPQHARAGDEAQVEAPLRTQPHALEIVRDDADVLSSEEERKLTGLLQDVRKQTGVEVLVVLVPTTAPDSSERYGGRLVEYLARRGAVDPAQTVVAVLEVKDRYLSVLAGHGLPALQRELASGGALKFLVPYLKEERYFDAMVALAQWLSGRIGSRGERT